MAVTQLALARVTSLSARPQATGPALAIADHAHVLRGALALAPGACAADAEGIHKIQHVVVIMQENRCSTPTSGRIPGADGIPGGVCVPDPLHGGCVKPFSRRPR